MSWDLSVGGLAGFGLDPQSILTCRMPTVADLLPDHSPMKQVSEVEAPKSEETCTTHKAYLS